MVLKVAILILPLPHSARLCQRGGVFLRDKFVADSVNGSDKDRTVRIALDFLPQLRDTVINGAVTGTLSLGPRGTDEPAARNNYLRPANEKLQHFELAKSDLHRLAGATEFHSPEIQGNISELRPLTDAPGLKVCHFQVRLPPLAVAYLSPGNTTDLSRNGHILVKSMHLKCGSDIMGLLR
jgi:hypothetical protein